MNEHDEWIRNENHPAYMNNHIYLCLFLLASICHGARVSLVGYASSGNPVTTNSICADFSLEDGVAVSFSQTDSQISLSPFDEDWAAIDDCTLMGDLTVVSGASNTVSVLFGNADDPAFTIESDGRWTILSAGEFVPHSSNLPPCPVQTNRMEFVMRTPHGCPRISAKASIFGGMPTNLPPKTWSWVLPIHRPENWQSITLGLAGPKARIIDFRLKWRPDGTQLIMR